MASLNKTIERPLKELKEGLQGLLGASLIKCVLYGSMARGDYDNLSDIDIAIVVRGLTRELKNEIFHKVAQVELEYLMPMSVIVFSEEGFEHLKKRERRIALDIEKEGIAL